MRLCIAVGRTVRRSRVVVKVHLHLQCRRESEGNFEVGGQSAFPLGICWSLIGWARRHQTLASEANIETLPLLARLDHTPFRQLQMSLKIKYTLLARSNNGRLHYTQGSVQQARPKDAKQEHSVYTPATGTRWPLPGPSRDARAMTEPPPDVETLRKIFEILDGGLDCGLKSADLPLTSQD